MYVPDIPNYAQTLYEAEQTLIPHGVADPTLGYYSPASSTKGLAVNQTFTDGITDVMAGRRPITDFDGLVRDWRATGGDQIRSEYEQAIAAAKA
jgi:putative aldouronate transport system substrate-binding protein